MAATYKAFLAAPSSSVLADDAALHYLTTTTSFHGSSEILKHLDDSRQVKKQSQEVINIIDGQHTIAVEVNTGFKFENGGGVYLPGVEAAFLPDETMQLPIMHIVTFNAEGKIAQIRQQWDQGSLLKQAEIIGKTGRNWPIKNGKEHLAFIQACLSSSGPAPAQPTTQSQTPTKPRGGIMNAMRDPYASLNLYLTQEERDAMPRPEERAPYAGQRPKQRAAHDFITDTPKYDDDAPKFSPAKGGMKGPQPMRIFDGCKYIEPEEDVEKKPKLPHISPHPSKYKHFSLGDGSDGHSSPSKGASNTLTNAFQKMDINGNASEEIPASQKENFRSQPSKPKEQEGIHIAGDGMGGRQGTKRNFITGDW